VIDLHSHVLPGLDDGPERVEESLEIMRLAAQDGTTTLAATPHARADFPSVRLSETSRRCRELLERVDGAAPSLVPAAEVDAVWAHGASDEDLRYASYGHRGTDLLLEVPHRPLDARFEGVVSQLQRRGYRILLAHPELSPTFQKHPGRLMRLVRRGVLLQLTARSLGPTERRSSALSRARALALALVDDEVAHVIASDAHSGGSWRPPNLSSGVAAAARLRPSRAEWMVTEAPAAILAGAQLPPPPIDRRRFRWLRSAGRRG
jgi:protein-tyrosine phosphatase